MKAGREGSTARHREGVGGADYEPGLISMFLIFQTHLYSSSQFLSECLRAVRSCAVKAGREGSTARHREGVGGADYEPGLISMFLIFQTHLYSSSQFLSECLRAVRSCAVKAGREGGTARYTEGVGGGQGRLRT